MNRSEKQKMKETGNLPERIESDYIAWSSSFYVDGFSDDQREVAIEAARRYNSYDQMREALELCRPYKDDCPIHKHDDHLCPTDCKFKAALATPGREGE